MKLINFIRRSVKRLGICHITEACMEEAASVMGARGQVPSQHTETDTGSCTETQSANSIAEKTAGIWDADWDPSFTT